MQQRSQINDCLHTITKTEEVTYVKYQCHGKACKVQDSANAAEAHTIRQEKLHGIDLG